MEKLILDDEIKRNLQYIVAKHFYGDASISEVKKIIDELMQANTWHDDLISIIDSDKSGSIYDVINKLRMLGLDLPKNKEQAFWHIYRYHISLMANNIKPITNLYMLAAYFETSEHIEYYKLDDLLEIYDELDGFPNLDDDVIKKSYIGGKWYKENQAFFDKMATKAIVVAKKWLANNDCG